MYSMSDKKTLKNFTASFFPSIAGTMLSIKLKLALTNCYLDLGCQRLSLTNSKKENSACTREIYNEVETPAGLSWAGSVLSTLMHIHQNKSSEPGKAHGTFVLRALCRQHPMAASPRLCCLHERERIFSPG